MTAQQPNVIARREKRMITSRTSAPSMHSVLLAGMAALALGSTVIAKRAAAQAAPAPTSATRPASTKPPPLFLWQVKSKAATVYLLGSIHVANEAMYPLDARIDQAFRSADTLVLETPMDASAQQQAAALLQRAGLYAPPDALDKHLDEKTMARLDAALRKLGLPLQAVMAMRPWLASLTITLLKLQMLGYEPALGIDQHFHAAAGKKRIAALENIEEQVAFFRSMPESAQIAALRQTLEQLDELADLMRRATEAWRRGDIVTFEKLLIEPTRKEYPELYRQLLVERNRRMTATLDRYLAGKGTTFVVVGGGHLVGADSIIRMLEARGHKPRRQ
jgi:uncharacterized protein